MLRYEIRCVSLILRQIKLFLKNIFIIFVCLLAQKEAMAQSRLNAYMDHLFRNRKFMGSVAVSFRDSIIYARSVGYADADQGTPLDSGTRMRIGSITKTYTAVLVLKAVEEGRLKLSDSLSAWYPHWPHAGQITIEMLLKHRSGIFNFTEIPGGIAWEEQPHTQEEFIAYASAPGVNFEPGTDYEYSNTNYALLGFILEKVYGKDFNALLQEKIAGPQGLKNTCYTVGKDTSGREALSYNIQDWYLHNATIHFSNHPASGGMLSTVVEVNRFLSALFSGRIISRESLVQMLPETPGEYGMGIEKLPFNNPKGYFHSGRIENFIADYWYFPDEQLGLVTLSNATNINTDDIQMVLLQSAYRNQPELPDFDQVEGLSKEEFGKLKGTYFDSGKTRSVTISSDGTSMIFQDSRAGQMYVPFTRKAGNTFEYEDILLHFDPDRGEVTLVQGDFRIVFRKGE